MSRARSTDINIKSAPQMLEYQAAADRIGAGGHQRVLDWGCGWGQLTRLLTDRGLEVTAFDFDPGTDGLAERALDRYPGLVATVSSDPRSLPFADGTFDAVLSMGVLEHVEDPDASLDEIRRILVPGGVFYCYKLPNRFSYLEFIARHSGMFYHGEAEFDTLYDLRSTSAIFARHGFEVSEVRRANMLPLTVQGKLPDRLGPTVWGANRGLARIPLFNSLATNIEVIARAPSA